MYAVCRLWPIVVTMVTCLAATAQEAVPEGDMAQRLEKLQQQQAELLGRLNDLHKQIEALKEEQRQRDLNASKTPASAKVGFGNLKIDGLLQQWFTFASGGGVNSSASVRRAEIKLSGDIRPDVHWVIVLDPAKPLVLTTTTIAGEQVVTGVKQSSRILKDAFISYTATPALSVDIGQQKFPFSMMGMRPSSQLPTVERPLINLLPYNWGRMGDYRDIGIQVRYATRDAQATLALMNDNGSSMNTVDDDNRLDTMYRIVYKGFPGMHLGIAGTLGNGSTGHAKSPFKRLGLEFGWTGNGHTVEAEYVRATDAPAGAVMRSRGGYVGYLYRLNPQLELAVRYEFWDPDTSMRDNIENDYTFGANWYLKGHYAKIQISLVRKVIGANAPAFLGSSRTLILSNFQTTW